MTETGAASEWLTTTEAERHRAELLKPAWQEAVEEIVKNDLLPAVRNRARVRSLALAHAPSAR